MEPAFVKEGADLPASFFWAERLLFFGISAREGGKLSPGPRLVSLTGASAPLYVGYRTTLGLTANLRGPFPCRCALTAVLLATKDTLGSSRPRVIGKADPQLAMFSRLMLDDRFPFRRFIVLLISHGVAPFYDIQMQLTTQFTSRSKLPRPFDQLGRKEEKERGDR